MRTNSFFCIYLCSGNDLPLVKHETIPHVVRWPQLHQKGVFGTRLCLRPVVSATRRRICASPLLHMRQSTLTKRVGASADSVLCAVHTCQCITSLQCNALLHKSSHLCLYCQWLTKSATSGGYALRACPYGYIQICE